MADKVLSINNLSYGSTIYVKDGQDIKKGQDICSWDPYNGLIISDQAGKVRYQNLEQGITYKVEIDEQTGFQEKVIVESKDKKKIPSISIVDKGGDVIKSYNLPLDAHLMVDDDSQVSQGDILVKIPRKSAKSGDITGGLPRITELFEARNSSKPAVVSEVDGVVSFGKIKRGSREIIVESKTGKQRKYLVKLSSQILVQENDYVKSGAALSEGTVTPQDILSIQGPTKVQEYLVNELQEVYRLQGVKIDDRHFEVIVRQMMRKVEIVDAGDTSFLERNMVHKMDFIAENDRIYGKNIVTDKGDSRKFKEGQIVTTRELREENSLLKREDKQSMEVRDVRLATAKLVLQGITRASLQTKSFMSAASFQETTKVLNEAAVNGRVDYLEGLKENVIVGHRIPAGTGLLYDQDVIVGSKEEYNDAIAETELKEEVL